MHALLLIMPLVVNTSYVLARDYAALQGSWVWVAVDNEGRKSPVPLGWPFKYVFTGKEYLLPATLHEPEKDNERGSFRLNPFTQPKQIDINNGLCVMQCIYEVDGDRLKIGFGIERPKDFTSKVDGQWVIYMRRQTVVDVFFEVLNECLPPDYCWKVP